MKRTILFLIFALCCLAGCNTPEQEAKERQVVLIYFAANNSLSSEGVGDYADLKTSYLPGVKETRKIVLVYHHFQDATPALVRLSRDSKGNLLEDIIMEYPFDTNSADAQTLSTVLADAEKAWPAAHHGLILWSHGSGFLPPGYYLNPKETAPGDRVFRSADPFALMVKAGDDVKSFAEDNGMEMDILDLRKVLSPTHYDYIIFDSCLMGNVEVAYELRNCCDFLLFSPTEILSDGFPYEAMMQPIFSLQPQAAMENIARSYMSHYRAMTGIYQSATITLVSTVGLNALAAACKPIFQNHQDQILTLDRSQVQPYFRFGKHWFYDIDDCVERVASSTEYLAFQIAIGKAVIFKDATSYFLDFPIEHYSGLSIYIPRPDYTVLNNYYKTLSWNQATGLVR